MNDNENRNDGKPKAKVEAVIPLGQFRSGKNWFVAFQFCDAEGNKQICTVPRRDCIKPFALRGYLADAGAPLGDDIESLRAISSEIASGNLAIVEPASISGWHGSAYLFGHQFIGEPDRNFIVLSTGENEYALEVAAGGSSEAWRKAMTDLPVYSYALTLGLCIAFASVMAGPLGIPPRMVHFFGPSSGGKTTLLVVSRSPFGNPNRDRLPVYNTTAMGFEELAALVRDHLLVIDEVTFKADGVDDEKMLRQIHYSFSTSQSKRRSRHFEPAQQPIGIGSSKLALSTGELSLADVARRVGSKRFRGAMVRAIDVPADLEYGLGVLRRLPSELEDQEDGARIYAQRLEASALDNYGRVGRRFLDHLVFDNLDWKNDARRRMKDAFEGLNVGSDSYSFRFAEIFALAYAAGKELIAAGLVDWDEGDLRHAIKRMYIKARECTLSPVQACDDALARLRRELEANAVNADRRTEIEDNVFDRANAFFRHDPDLGPVYLVRPEFLDKLGGIELGSRDIAAALEKLGVLIRGTAGVPTRQFMIGASRPRTRYFCIRASFVRNER